MRKLKLKISEYNYIECFNAVNRLELFINLSEVAEQNEGGNFKLPCPVY
jgi:hypothetical protein